jgi:hypothetical protein
MFMCFFVSAGPEPASLLSIRLIAEFMIPRLATCQRAPRTEDPLLQFPSGMGNRHRRPGAHGMSKLADTVATPILVDGRNFFDPEAARISGFDYVGIDRCVPLRGDQRGCRRPRNCGGSRLIDRGISFPSQRMPNGLRRKGGLGSPALPRPAAY